MADGVLLEMRFPAAASRLKDVRAELRTAVTRAGCGPDCAEEIVLAVDEACQNVIRHAYVGGEKGEVVLRVERERDSVVLWLRDFAPRVDPERIASRDLDDVRPGGLGVHLIHELMDECGFVPQDADEGNLFRMRKRVR